MKNYYLIRTSSDSNVIGVKNGIQQVEICREGYDNPDHYDEIFQNLGSFDSWEKAKKYNNPKMEIEYVKMLKGAKLTDFLSYGPVLIRCPFLISYKAYSIFSRFNIQNSIFYKANVYKDNKESILYYLLSCNGFDRTHIDYDSSVFFVGNKIIGKKYLKFNSKEDELNYSKKTGADVKLEKLFFKKNVLCDLDFFISPYRDIYISEELKFQFEINGVNGLNILPAFGEVSEWPIICTSCDQI